MKFYQTAFMVACSPLFLSAEDTPSRFDIGGYGQVLAAMVDEETSDSNDLNFSARADLTIGWQLSSSLNAYVEVSFEESDNGDADVSLEEAYASYQVNELVTFKLGRFHQWFGWERHDAPDLWRVNESFTFYNSGDLDGAAFLFMVAEQWMLNLYVVDEVITPRDSSQFKDGTELAYGSSLRFQPDYGLFKFDFYYDIETAPSYVDGDDSGDVWTSSLNGELLNIDDSPWSFSWDIAYGDNPNGNQLFILSAARYELSERRMALTLMINYLDENYDSEAIDEAASEGLSLVDNERVEFSISVLNQPTDSDLFSYSIEVNAIDSSIPNEDSIGVFVELLALFK